MDGEGIRVFVEFGFVVLDELLYMRILVLCGVGVGEVGAVQGFRAGDISQFGRIPSVTAQDRAGDPHFTGLFDDLGNFFIVAGNIQGFRIGGFQFGQCGLEVLVLGQEGFLANHFAAFFFQGLAEYIHQALGVITGGIIENRHILHFQGFGGKFGHQFSLEGVREAGTENIRTDLAFFIHRDAGSRSYRSHQRDLAVGHHRRGSRYAAAGSRPDDDGHFILGDQLGGRVAGFGRLRFVVSFHQFDFLAVDATLGVDLLHSQLYAFVGGFAVVGHVAGQFEQSPDPDFITAVFLAAAGKHRRYESCHRQRADRFFPCFHQQHLCFPEISLLVTRIEPVGPASFMTIIRTGSHFCNTFLQKRFHF